MINAEIILLFFVLLTALMEVIEVSAKHQFNNFQENLSLNIDENNLNQIINKISFFCIVFSFFTAILMFAS
jgi:hypothetical protein